MHICMEWKSISFDWNLVRAFLVTVEEGSFSAASRALGLTQPTLGRQVAALEKQLNVTLFERAGHKLLLTTSGIELIQHVREMGNAASRISLTAHGQSQKVEGNVCITATDITAQFFLPQCILEIREKHPNIQIEIVASNDLRDLRRREADIAIRHSRPDQPDLIAKLLCETTAHIYSSKQYFEKIGSPQTVEELSDADFVGFGRSDNHLLTYFNGNGFQIDHSNFMVTSESGMISWEMVRQGLGIGFMAKSIAERTEGIIQVLPDVPPAVFPIWLVTHRELHTSRPIRLVYDILAESIKNSFDPKNKKT